MTKIRLTQTDTGQPVEIDLADIKTFNTASTAGLNSFGIYLPSDMLNVPTPISDTFRVDNVQVVLKQTFMDTSGTRYAHHLLCAGARRTNRTVATLQTTDEITAAILRIEWAERQGQSIDVYDLHGETQGRISAVRQRMVDGLHALGSQSVPVEGFFGQPTGELNVFERIRAIKPGQTI